MYWQVKLLLSPLDFSMQLYTAESAPRQVWTQVTNGSVLGMNVVIDLHVGTMPSLNMTVGWRFHYGLGAGDHPHGVTSVLTRPKPNRKPLGHHWCSGYEQSGASSDTQ